MKTYKNYIPSREYKIGEIIQLDDKNGDMRLNKGERIIEQDKSGLKEEYRSYLEDENDLSMLRNEKNFKAYPTEKGGMTTDRYSMYGIVVDKGSPRCCPFICVLRWRRIRDKYVVIMYPTDGYEEESKKEYLKQFCRDFSFIHLFEMISDYFPKEERKKFLRSDGGLKKTYIYHNFLPLSFVAHNFYWSVDHRISNKFLAQPMLALGLLTPHIDSHGDPVMLDANGAPVKKNADNAYFRVDENGKPVKDEYGNYIGALESGVYVKKDRDGNTFLESKNGNRIEEDKNGDYFEIDEDGNHVIDENGAYAKAGKKSGQFVEDYLFSDTMKSIYAKDDRRSQYQDNILIHFFKGEYNDAAASYEKYFIDHYDEMIDELKKKFPHGFPRKRMETISKLYGRSSGSLRNSILEENFSTGTVWFIIANGIFLIY